MLNNKNRTVLSCPVFLLFTFKILLKYSKNFAAAPEREWKRFHANTAVSSRRGFSGLKTILLSSNKSTAPSMVSPQAAPLLINIAACVIILTVASTFNLLISAPSQLEISFCTYKREGVISGTPSKSLRLMLLFCASGLSARIKSPQRSLPGSRKYSYSSISTGSSRKPKSSSPLSNRSLMYCELLE